MSKQHATPREMLWVGAIAAAVGLYFVLVGAGALPVPGGPRNLHGPLWIVLCAGLAFLLGGAVVLLQGIGRANQHGEFPANAPPWMRVVQYLAGLAIFACFGAIATWIAFGTGPRKFSGSLPGLDGAIGAGLGRTMFGIGAVIIWLGTIAVAVSGARKLLGRDRT